MQSINFFAPINQDAFNGIINGIPNNSQPLEIKFASNGGDVSTSFRMYNYLRSLNKPIIMNNVGDVSSVAIIVFLAADFRIAQPNSMFLIHRLACELQGSSSFNVLQNCTNSLKFDIDRYNSVFNERTASGNAPIDIYPTLIGGPEIILDNVKAFSCGILNNIVPLL